MLDFYKKELFWFSLQYKNTKMEKEFKTERESYQRWTFILFYSLLTAISIILWMAGLGSSQPYTIAKILANVGRILLLFLTNFFINRYPSKVEVIIILTLSIGNLSYVEINRNSIYSLDSLDIFLYGLLIQTIIILAILIRVNYIRLVVLLLFNNSYTSLRFFHVENADWLFMKSLFLMSANFFFLIAFAYGKEVYERKVSFELKTYQNSLSLYERMIREIIPVSVIIYDDDNIFFCNEETKRILKLNSNELDKQILEKIIVKDLKNLNYKSVDRNLRLNEKRSSEILSLFALMKSMIPKKDIISCSAFFPDDQESLAFKIKISKIIWNGKNVKIIFFTEDQAAYELILLKQKEIFRDRFLATMSHEFRTPLNGSIGMLTIAIEQCKDKFIKRRFGD